MPTFTPESRRTAISTGRRWSSKPPTIDLQGPSPNPECLQRRSISFQDAALDRLGNAILTRTDQHGTVRLSTDCERLWVSVERVR